MSPFVISDNISNRMVQRKALSMESNFTCITDHSTILHTIFASALIVWLQIRDHVNSWG